MAKLCSVLAREHAAGAGCPEQPNTRPLRISSTGQGHSQTQHFKKNKIFRYITSILVRDEGSINVPDSQLGAVAD